MKHLVFKGLKHYPSGNTILYVNNNVLEVAGMIRLQDGITIDTDMVRSWNISLLPMIVTANSVFGATFNSVRKGQLSRMLSQWLIMQSPDERYAYIVVNNTGSKSVVHVNGWRENSNVFSSIYQPVKGKQWETVVVFRLFGKPLVVTDAGYIQDHESERSLEKSIVVSGFVCLNGNEQHLVAVDRISITCYAASSLNIHSERIEINQVVLSGQHIRLSILNESYTP